jgi:hypothetical protein
MTWGLRILILFLAQSSVPREVVQLARVKHDMSTALERIPNYTCMETVVRSVSEAGSKGFKIHDTQRIDVAYIGGRELYSRHGAGKIDKIQPGHFIPFGVTSTGEFVSHARSVFGNAAPARIRYRGPRTFDGREAFQWSYSIPYMWSGWTIQYAGRVTRVASEGSFWADATSLEVMRLDIDATEIEPGFPITQAHESIRYGRVQLGSSLALIPVSTDVLLTERGGTVDRNAVEFTQCKEYRAESDISFDSDPGVKR